MVRTETVIKYFKVSLEKKESLESKKGITY